MLSWLPSFPTFFVAFTMIWAYAVQKLSHSVRRKYFSKIGKDGGFKNFT